MDVIIENLNTLIMANIIISIIWSSSQKKNAVSKKEYWIAYKRQILIWTPTVLISIFFDLNSADTIGYSTIYIVCLIIFTALIDFYKKFEV